MEKIDYNRISNSRGMNEKLSCMQEEIERCRYISLTDAISLRGRGGQLVMEFLDDEFRRNGITGKHRIWKLRCLKHPDGSVPKPGDEIRREINNTPRALDRKKLTLQTINQMHITGEINKYKDVRTFTVDEDGCITCSYDDAGWFLSTFGVHYNTGYPLGGMREVTGGGGKSRATWNWRFVEVLPSDEPAEETEKQPKKRG